MKFIYLCLTLIYFSIHLYAQEKDVAEKEPKPIPEPEISETKQTVKINGETIPLIAKAGTMLLHDEENKPVALFGFTSYIKEGNDKNRPLVFAYNGGPGSSSIWLHMGALGPKRIILNDPDYNKAAPYRIENNEYSILDIADLIMIDPVGTGLSRPVGDAEYKDFWGVDQDIKSISSFIHQFLIENNRLNSPKFLLGESYGTFRNAGVMKYMQDEGISFNGVIMVSAVFDLRYLLFPPNDILPYILHLPTYAATAWYHNKIDKNYESLESFLEEVREFAKNEYAPALFKGDKISEEETSAITAKLNKYTGISIDTWEKANLKLRRSEFLQELLRDEGYTVDRLDSRLKGINQDLLSQYPLFEPLDYVIGPAFKTGFQEYFYNQLKVNKNLQYNISASGLDDFKWDWKHEGNISWNAQAAINTSNDMAQALSRDPNLKVLILNGYFDNGTVFYGVEYTIDHLELREEIKKNIIMKYYESGHMIYTHEPSLKKFKHDIANFIQSCLY